MIGYVTLGTDDLDRARAYYDVLLGTIGATRLMQFGEEEGGFTMYGTGMAQPAIVITKPYNKEPANCGNGNMIAIMMDSRERVDAFHAKALELGGTDEGPPGFRGDPKFGYYFAYFRDPDGHKLAAFTIQPQTS
jgi:catechol 2,3-dioxygenase-like lactoylglutathione lyase family enzyme